jgi:hypothetical protein
MAILGIESNITFFGDAVAIDGDNVVVGASEFPTKGRGAVYVYRIVNGTSISQVAKLVASDGVEGDVFGGTLSIQGNYLLVSANGVDKYGSSEVGLPYLFGNPSNDPNTPQWTQMMQVQPNDLSELKLFGVSMAMADNIAVVGSYSDAANIFEPVSSNETSDSLSSSLLSSWTQVAKLTGSIGSMFGNSVAVAGNWVVVGANYDSNSNGNSAGAAFVFTRMTSSSILSWTQLTR